MIVPNEPLEIAWVTAMYFHEVALSGIWPTKTELLYGIVNEAYVQTYGSLAPYPIPENYEQIANCQGWADAWLRMFDYLKNHLVKVPKPQPFPPVPGPKPGRHIRKYTKRFAKKDRYGKLAKLFA